MTEAEVLTELSALARRELDFEGRLSPDARLIETLRLDSLRLLTLAVAVENHFRVRLEEGEEAEVETAGELARLILARRADGERPA